MEDEDTRNFDCLIVDCLRNFDCLRLQLYQKTTESNTGVFL